MLLSVATQLLPTGSRRRLLAQADQADLARMLQPTLYTYESEYEMLEPSARHEILTEPGWNATAQPCAGLVLAYQAFQGESQLGILDTHALHRCAYWRYVGRRVSAAFDMQGVPDTFLLSTDDFSAALADRTAMRDIINNPWAIVRAMLYHPYALPLETLCIVHVVCWPDPASSRWFRPARTLAISLANLLETTLSTAAHAVDRDLWDAVLGDIHAINASGQRGSRRLLDVSGEFIIVACLAAVLISPEMDFVIQSDTNRREVSWVADKRRVVC